MLLLDQVLHFLQVLQEFKHQEYLANLELIADEGVVVVLFYFPVVLVDLKEVNTKTKAYLVFEVVNPELEDEVQVTKFLDAVLVEEAEVFLEDGVPPEHGEEVLAEDVGACRVDLRVLL